MVQAAAGVLNRNCPPATVPLHLTSPAPEFLCCPLIDGPGWLTITPLSARSFTALICSQPAGVVLSTSTRGDLCMLIMESLGICRDLLRVGQSSLTVCLRACCVATVVWWGRMRGNVLRTLAVACGPRCQFRWVWIRTSRCSRKRHISHSMHTKLSWLPAYTCAEGVDVIQILQQRDEAEMARHGTAHGSAMRQKWLHTIHVRELQLDCTLLGRPGS